jgi:hypothetical protein
VACIPQQAILIAGPGDPRGRGSGVTRLSRLWRPLYESVSVLTLVRSNRSLTSRWDAKLTRPLQVRDGPKLETLADAGRLIGTLSLRDQGRQAWIRATEILMAAAERGGSIDEATDAIDAALFLQGKLELRNPLPRC